MDRACPIEEIEGKPRHLLRVPAVDPEPACHGQRPVRQRLVPSHVAIPAEKVDEDPVPQAAIDGLHRAEPEVVHRAVQDDGARHDDLRPARVEPMAALVHRHRGELLRRPGDFLARRALAVAASVSDDGIDRSRTAQRPLGQGGVARK